MVCSLISFILIIEVISSFPLMCTAHLQTTILVTIWIGSYHCKNKIFMCNYRWKQWFLCFYLWASTQLQSQTIHMYSVYGHPFVFTETKLQLIQIVLQLWLRPVTVKALLSTQMCQQRHNSKAYLICRFRMNACCMRMFSHTHFRYKWIIVCHYRNANQIKAWYCLQGSALDFFPMFFKITWFSINRSCLFQSVSANHRIWLSQ